MTLKPVPLSVESSTQWAATAQYRFLDALMADPRLECAQIAFHGGTSLHFSWRSPRLSEDLDFLMAKDAVDIDASVEHAFRKTREAFQAEDPRFTVEIQAKGKSDGRMISYHLKISHPAYLGKALIKAEFWKVDPSYLANYPVELRIPIRPGDV